MGLKKILAGLVAVVALLGMSGCSQSSNTAATVNGVVITEEYVQSSARYLTETLSSEPGYANFDFVGFVLRNTIMEEILSDTLSQMGITVTDQNREQVWNSLFDPNSLTYKLWADPKARPTLLGYIDLAMVQTSAQSGNLDTDKLVALIDAVSVSVNPRYGQWDSESLNLSSRVAPDPVGTLADPVPFSIPA